MDARIQLPYKDPHVATPLATTLLKEGYSLSLDDASNSGITRVADFTIYKNEEIVKRMKVKRGDYIYYNKTIGGIEYTIIESKLEAIFRGTPNNMVMLRPFYQYSDGSNIIEPDFVSANLNPKTTEAPYEEWNRRFGGIYDDNVWSVQRTSDDGYILGGTIKSQNPEGPPMYVDIPLLIKVDANGNEIWKKTFGDFGYTSSVLHLLDGGNIFVAIKSFEMPSQQTSDGGFILAGKSRLVKTDSNGKEQWSKTIKLFGVDGFYTTSSVQETPDGGYILTGKEAWISKTDSNGTEQLSRTFGGAGYDSLNSVRNTLDSGYIFAGRTGRYGTGSDAWLFKTDANGNLEWSKTIGGLKRDEARFVQETKDSGYLIAGTTESYGSGGSDIWLVKVSGGPEGIENISMAIKTETHAASPTQTTTAVPTETSTIIPPEKAAGFELVLVITILLAVNKIGKKRR